MLTKKFGSLVKVSLSRHGPFQLYNGFGGLNIGLLEPYDRGSLPIEQKQRKQDIPHSSPPFD